MITVIRDYFKGGKVILWVIIAAFVVGLMPLAFRSMTSTSPWALRINGKEIEYREFQVEQERQREKLIAFRQQFGEYADMYLSMMGANPQALAIQSLTRQELINQFADQLGIQVSPDYIAQKMGDSQFVMRELGEIVPPQVVDSLTGINQEMLSRYLQHRGLSTDLFEREIERKLTDRLMTNLILSTLYVPRFDVKQRYQAEQAKKSFSILMISLKDLLEKEQAQAVSPEDLEKFYSDQNKQAQQYWVPEKRSGSMWSFDPESYGIKVSDEQAENYYEKNKIQQFIDKPAMVQVRRILIVTLNGKNRMIAQEEASCLKDEIMQDPSQFAAIATRSSDDKETAKSGGLLEPFSRGSHEQAFDRAAFLLPEDGAVSEIIETKDGLEILQRVKKTPQQFKSLSTVKGDIEKTLRKQKFKSQFTADMRELLEKQESLDGLIAQKGGKPEQLESVMAKDSMASEHLFKLKTGEKSFFVDDTTGTAVQLNAIHERYLPSLESIKKTVTNDYHRYKAKKSLQGKLAEAKKLVATTSLEELQKQFEGAQFIQTGKLEPDHEDAHESLKKKGIPVTKMLQMEKVGAILTDSDSETGFVVIVDEIEPFNQQQFNEKEGEISRALQQERTQQYLEGFVASLHRNAKIETNESIITLQA